MGVQHRGNDVFQSPTIDPQSNKARASDADVTKAGRWGTILRPDRGEGHGVNDCSSLRGQGSDKWQDHFKL